MKTLSSLLLLSTFFPAGLAAQNSYTVGGSNPDFASLELALTATTVQAGDVLLVRRGTYSISPIQKAVTILGEAGVVLQGTNSLVVAVQGITVGQRLVLKNAILPGPLLLSQCAGRVHLEDIQANSCLAMKVAAASMVRLQVTDGLTAQESALVLNDCSLRAAPGSLLAATALVVRLGARVLVSGGTIQGSDGGQVLERYHSPMPGILSYDGDVTVMRGSTVLAGSPDGATPDIPAIEAFGANARLTLDPTATLLARGAASTHRGFASVDSRRSPRLRTSGGSVGAQASYLMHGDAGDPYILFGSWADQGPLHIPGIVGRVWMDPVTLLGITSGQFPTTGLINLNRSIPNVAALRGAMISLQVLAQSKSGEFTVSNPSSLLVH